MQSKFVKTDFDLLKGDILSLFNEDHSKIQFVVSKSEQDKEINLLKETLENERFFFVVNLLNFEIEKIHGVQKYLGYSEKDFTFKKYWNHLIHPGKQVLKLLARHMYETLCNGNYPLKFIVQRFTSLVPLKHYNGNYLLTKKTSSVFQYDIKNRLIAYIDEFTIINDYKGEPFDPRMWLEYDKQDSPEKKAILDKMINDFIGMKIFSPGELQVARKLAYNTSITQADIARELGLTVNTINTYYKRFLEKSRDFFQIDFATMADATSYLKRECIL